MKLKEYVEELNEILAVRPETAELTVLKKSGSYAPITLIEGLGHYADDDFISEDIDWFPEDCRPVNNAICVTN